MSDLPKNQVCEQDGCDEAASVACILPDYDKDPSEDIITYYCAKHAADNGYCYLCVRFCAGTEQFDFPESYGIIPGLCETCSDCVRADAGEFDDYEDDFYFGPDFEP